MGSRGASSGRANNGKAYGTEYRTVLKAGNIKFVIKNEGSSTAPMETMTRGRVYVTVNDKQEISSISYYDKDNKRVKQIDLNHTHKGMKPHTHHGYNHNENDSAKGAANVTSEERKMIDRVKKLWYNQTSHKR
ncbi:MAG: hypothetical protein IJJ45_05945 [Clostridia bacterium]|nr:hypothetical protein [Clostridia bacterium]